jgi:hypothetical protein
VTVAAVAAVVALLLQRAANNERGRCAVSHTCMINISSGSCWTLRNKDVAMVAKVQLEVQARQSERASRRH